MLKVQCGHEIGNLIYTGNVHFQYEYDAPQTSLYFCLGSVTVLHQPLILAITNSLIWAENETYMYPIRFSAPQCQTLGGFRSFSLS